MNGHSLIAVAVVLALSGLASGGGWTDDFESYSDAAALRAVWGPERFAAAHQPQLARDAGSSYMAVSYNGNAGVRGFDLPAGPDDAIVICARVRGQARAGTLRMSVGPEAMAWNRAQGHLVFTIGERPSVVNELGRIAAAGEDAPTIEADRWYELELVVSPNPIRGGTYQAFVDGVEIGPTVGFDHFKAEVPAAVRFGYYGTGDGSFFIDDVSAAAGESRRAELPLRERIGVELPPPGPMGRWHHDNTIAMPLRFCGSMDAAKSLEAALFINHGNHADEAESEPIQELMITPDGSGRCMATFEDVPFGMYTFRVLAAGEDRAYEVLAEDLVAMTHRTPSAADPNAWVWGIDGHADRNDRRIDLELGPLTEAGANWTRMEILWRDIVDDSGEPDFSHHDKVVAEASARNIRVFAVLTTTARHATAVKDAGYGCPPKLDAYEQWLRKVFTHFAGRVDHFEILNEPDGYSFWWFAPGSGRAAWQSEMIKIAARVAREVSPEIRVMGPSVTVIGRPYFQRLIDDGAFDEIDDITHHAGGWRHPRDFHQQLRRMLAERYPGRTFRWWSTEGGNWDGAMLASFAEAEPVRLFKYTIRDKGSSRESWEHNNGLVKLYGTPKEAFIGHQNMARCFAGSRYVGRALAARGLEAYLFERDGVLTLGFWSEDGRVRSIALPEAAEQGAAAIDWLGNPLAADAHTGEWPVPRRDRPSVVVGVGRPSDVALDASVNCSGDYARATPVKPVELVFAFENLLDASQRYELELVPPAGWALSHERLAVEVEPGAVVRSAPVLAEIPHDSDSGDVWIDGVLSANGRRIAKRFGPIWVVNELRLRHVMVDDFENGGRWAYPGQVDVHTAQLDADGNVRSERDLSALVAENGFSVVSDPVYAGKSAGRFDFGWTRPADGWGWMACTFELAEPATLPGEPVELRMKVFMPECERQYPTTLLAKLEDAEGEVFLIEGGGEIYWRGWRQFRLTIPSRLGDGYVHSVWGAAGNRRLDPPVRFRGLVFNQPPNGAITHFPADQPATRAWLAFDDIEIVCHE